jgi:hypothetical protein
MIGESLRLHEELMLLCRGEHGRIVGAGHHANWIAGAALVELILQRRVLLDPVKKKLFVRLIDSRLLGDAVLDEALEKIRTSKKPKVASSWIMTIALLPKLVHRITERLWLSGLLRREEKPFLFLFKRTLYPLAHPVPRQRIIDRLRAAIQGEGAVEPRTAVIVACAHGNQVLTQVLERAQLKLRKRRIKTIIESDSLAQALSQAVPASMPHHGH